MPGILPMKVIRVGNGAQSRVAQACDRCRSKKIRCDGVRPCCTQCANVGFECKTSDKLSRRAFPRGYTESLEERVRSLEAEVRDLKNLLDEKDEKIDVLSRIHSFSPPSHHQPRPSLRPPSIEPAKPTAPEVAEERIKVHPLAKQSSDSSFAGLSSTCGFVDAFNSKLAEGGVPTNVPTQALTESPSPIPCSGPDQTLKVPPRLVSDQLINIFFQEWAPLYPVVHRPTALKAYEQYVSNLESFKKNTHEMTQLNLIFGIAGLASKSRTNHDPTFFEENWSSPLESLSNDVSVPTLQCLVLAQMYCMTKADYKTLLRYRSLGVSISQQLGLHRTQGNSSSNTLAIETRKKVFWCQYVLDRFAAALTGVPVLLREEDISTQYPEDIDDENVTETGFLPTLPGESTRLSSALALFAVSRILYTALVDLYPSEIGHEISVSKMRSVAGQLDEWSRNLPSHLRLEFPQDKPSTNVTSSRSPLLSVIYYYIRSLIQRPAVCFAVEQIKSPSVLLLSDSSKHIIQILELLDERRLCLSININRRELVFMAGLGLLWQNMGLKRDSKLVKESRKLLTSVVDQLESESPAAAAEFSGIANVLVSLDGRRGPASKPAMSAPSEKQLKFPKKQMQSWKQRLAGGTVPDMTEKPESPSRRATVTGTSPPGAQNLRSPSLSSVPSVYSEPVQRRLAGDQYMTSPGLEHEHTPVMASAVEPANGVMTMADWEYVLSDMDRGYSNIFTGIYGGKDFEEDNGQFASLTAEYNQKVGQMPTPVARPKQEMQDLSPETWSNSGSDMTGQPDSMSHSMLSHTRESIGSVEDNSAFYELPFRPDEQGAGFMDPFQGMMMPAEEEIGDLGLGWDRPLVV